MKILCPLPVYKYLPQIWYFHLFTINYRKAQSFTDHHFHTWEDGIALSAQWLTTELTTEGQIVVQRPAASRDSSLLRSIQTKSGGPPCLWFKGAGTLPCGVDWLSCEVDHSSPPHNRAKNMWRYTPTPPAAFITCTKTTTPLNTTFEDD